MCLWKEPRAVEPCGARAVRGWAAWEQNRTGGERAVEGASAHAKMVHVMNSVHIYVGFQMVEEALTEHPCDLVGPDRTDMSTHTPHLCAPDQISSTCVSQTSVQHPNPSRGRMT
jgi:hypothetical protein